MDLKEQMQKLRENLLAVEADRVCKCLLNQN